MRRLALVVGLVAVAVTLLATLGPAAWSYFAWRDTRKGTEAR